MSHYQYVVLTPVRDEASYIVRTIESMRAQTIQPKRWIVVDDGSIDGTGEILDNYAKTIPWLKVVHRTNRGFRASGSGVMEAFSDGYAALTETDWDFIVKLDGDLSFDADYFEKCFQYFRNDSKLGIGGGTVCVRVNERLVIDSQGDPPFHVRGATKIYRRSCWDQIGPLPKATGWDTIDEVKANYFGWTTRTFQDLILLQHKPTGSSDGKWRNWFKNGVANYMTGYHPLFMLAKCLKRTIQRPLLLSATALLAGFCTGYIKRMPIATETEVVRYLRQQQIKRLLMKNSIYGI